MAGATMADSDPQKPDIWTPAVSGWPAPRARPPAFPSSGRLKPVPSALESNARRVDSAPDPLTCALGRRRPPARPPAPQAHAKVPDEAWEYQIRKALNDAAYNGLEYVGYCSTMPVQQVDDNPKWMWRKKGAK